MMNLRLARPAMVVDLNEIPGLDGIDERDGMLVIGAMARQRDVERSPLCLGLCPLLASALRHVGNPQTRNRGTIGGNLAQADPASELPTVVAACGGVIVLASARRHSRAGLRRVLHQAVHERTQPQGSWWWR